MKKIILLLLTSFALYPNTFAQKKTMSEEEVIKMASYTSILSDGSHSTNYESIDEYIRSLKEYYTSFEFFQSPKMLFYKPNMPDDSIGSKYQIQLIKVEDYNSKNQHRYLMWYKDFSNEVWLRVGGYVENDLNLLFNYLRKQGVTKKHLKTMLGDWCISDPMFGELDWNCLFTGYLRNKTTSKCFWAVYYIRENDTSISFDPHSAKELYSRFARSCLIGYFHLR